MPFNIVNGNHSELVVYLVLNIWPSHFGLPLLLLVIMLSKKIQRSTTFLNMLVVWIIVGMCVLHQSKLELLLMGSIYVTCRSSTLLCVRISFPLFVTEPRLDYTQASKLARNHQRCFVCSKPRSSTACLPCTCTKPHTPCCQQPIFLLRTSTATLALVLQVNRIHRIGI